MHPYSPVLVTSLAINKDKYHIPEYNVSMQNFIMEVTVRKMVSL